MFMTYKREEGDPLLDNAVFGPKRGFLRPSDGDENRFRSCPSVLVVCGHCIVGFDLRLVKPSYLALLLANTVSPPSVDGPSRDYPHLVLFEEFDTSTVKASLALHQAPI
jgi:hypothetical protein